MSENQIHLRLTDAMRDEVEAYAASYETSVAAAIRRLIREGLNAVKAKAKS